MREHQDGDFPFANDFNAIVQALADDALVVSGCDVSDGGTDDMTVSIASGSVRINGSKYSVGSQSVTLANADSSYDRYDLVVVGTDGTAEAVTGTASSTPKAPSIPADHALLAIIEVPAGTSGVMDSEISDARTVHSLAQNFDDHQQNFDSHASDNSAHHAKYSPPSGLIALWSGSISNIPSGWVLCDGNNGTPNLQDLFVVGAGSSYSVGTTGGTSTVQLTDSEMPSHRHQDQLGDSGGDNEAIEGAGSHGTLTTDSRGGDSAHENKPPYYALAYIMKT